MKTLLWLDDTRDPLANDGHWLVFSPIENPYEVIWVKNYNEFTSHIKEKGLPDGICFDHDLGLADQLKWRAKGKSKRESRRLAREEGKTGKDCADFLVDYCMDHDLKLPPYNIQSANPVGKANIDGLLQNFIKFQSK